MKYIVRLNMRAFNPLTNKVNPKLLWEVEQCQKIGGNGRTDSQSVIWHCADVKIDDKHIREFFRLPKTGEQPWKYEVWGVCVRDQDNVIKILTGPVDVSGN